MSKEPVCKVIGKGIPSKEDKTVDKKVKNLKKLLGDKLDARDDMVLDILKNNLQISENAQKLIMEDGLMVEGRGGELVKNPMIDVAKNSEAIVFRILESYGATLRSKNILKENKEEEEQSVLDKYLSEED